MLLAAEIGEKTIWNPTILGVLVVLSAIGLFCGSVYLLLATNLGARLGFLVSAATLSGFLVLLSILWMTTQTPLNSPKGREAEWKAREVVDSLDESGIEAVRTIEAEGEEISTADLANVRPGVDAALVTPDAAAATDHGGAAEPSEFATFENSSAFLVGEQDLGAFEVGGGTKNFFWHHPRFAAIQFCPVLEQVVEFGQPPPDPRCDPAQGSQWVILERDLGSIRQPPVFYFIGFSVLFALSLLGLHWYEQDQRERTRRGLAPVPTS
jgi:hypothetical protein